MLKHAEARTITVRTGTGPGADGGPGVFVEIRDDGRGPGPLRPGGRGVAHMRSRAGALGGEVTIAAAADGGNVTVAHATPGTSVRIWLPLEGRPAMRAG